MNVPSTTTAPMRKMCERLMGFSFLRRVLHGAREPARLPPRESPLRGTGSRANTVPYAGCTVRAREISAKNRHRLRPRKGALTGRRMELTRPDRKAMASTAPDARPAAVDLRRGYLVPRGLQFPSADPSGLASTTL